MIEDSARYLHERNAYGGELNQLINALQNFR